MPYLVRTHLPSFAYPVGSQSLGLTRKLRLL
jgi:hypothetical protein